MARNELTLFNFYTLVTAPSGVVKLPTKARRKCKIGNK